MIDFLSPEILAAQAIEEKLEIPALDKNGRTPTLNEYGPVANFIDPMSEEFLKQISYDKKSLEIGSAYGNITLKALKQGSKNFTVNDLDIRHLKLLALRLKKEIPELLQYLKMVQGRYPDQVEFPAESFDSILISRVLHFFTPKLIKNAIQDLYRILKPGGKVYALTISVYTKAYGAFIPVFEEAKKSKKQYPGYVEDRLKYANTPLIDPKNLSYFSGPFMFFDNATLAELFKEEGFRIKKSTYFSCEKSNIFYYDGREGVGVIAEKL